MRSRLLTAARSLLCTPAAAQSERGSGAASCSRAFSNVVNQARGTRRASQAVHRCIAVPAHPSAQHRDTPLNNVETPFEFTPANAKQARRLSSGACGAGLTLSSG